MAKVDDLSRSLAVLDQEETLICVVELSQSSWLIAGMVPGVERQPLKKLEPDAPGLMRVIERWRDEAIRAERMITRIVLAYEAGRDGFWLARWMRARGVEVDVIHSTSVAVSREHRRAKTDRLDTAMLMRVFLGWLRGERGHCSMVAVPTIDEEDAKRPGRERESLVGERTRIINRMKAALARLGIRGFKPELRNAPARLEALRTPEEVMLRGFRDRRAVARYAGLTGAPDESGAKRREKGLAKSGNSRVRRGLIQLAWRFLLFQRNSALARWYVERTSGTKGARKTTMIVALARKLLIALWRLATTGLVPDGVVLRSAV